MSIPGTRGFHHGLLAPWNWQAPRDSAVYCGPDFPGACSSSPDTDGVLQPCKSLTMLDLLAMETDQNCTGL